MTEETEKCPGCGLFTPKADGGAPPHEYLGASAGCWALYSELLGKQYAGWGAPLPIRLIDAYAVQHPGVPERRSIQSVTVHLVALYLQLEKGYDEQRVNRAMVRLLDFAKEFVWLEPPLPNGTLTVADIWKAGTREEYARLVRAYAEDVWRAWQPHRATVERWANVG